MPIFVSLKNHSTLLCAVVDMVHVCQIILQNGPHSLSLLAGIILRAYIYPLCKTIAAGPGQG